MEARRQQALRTGGLMAAGLLGGTAGSRRGWQVSVKPWRPPRRGDRRWVGRHLGDGAPPERALPPWGSGGSGVAPSRLGSLKEADEQMAFGCGPVLAGLHVRSCEPLVSKRIVLGTTCEALRLAGVDTDLRSIVLPWCLNKSFVHSFHVLRCICDSFSGSQFHPPHVNFLL